MTTKFVVIDKNRELEPQLAEAAKVIKNGGLVAFPTETVYGLGSKKGWFLSNGRGSYE